MAINLDHNRSILKIGESTSEPNEIANSGILYVKNTDGSLYYKDDSGNENDLGLSPTADAIRIGYDLSIAPSVETDSAILEHLESSNTQFSTTYGAFYDKANSHLYVVGTRKNKEEVPDPEFREATISSDWTLTNDSIFVAANDHIDFNGAGTSFGISFNTNATVSRSYDVTYRRAGSSTDAVAPVVGGTALYAETFEGTYTETVVAASATSLFSVTGTVTDNDLQFELVSITQTVDTPDAICAYDVTADTQFVFDYTHNHYEFATLSTPRGVSMSDDGTKLIIGDGTGNLVYELILSTAYLLSTATEEATPFNPSELTSLVDAQASPDGRWLFCMTDDAARTIYQYEMSTPWDLDTATYTNQNLVITTALSGNYSFKLSDNGRYLYVLDATNLDQYNLGDVWMIDSGVWNNSWNVLQMRSLFFINDGQTVCNASTADTFYRNIVPVSATVNRASETVEGLTRYATDAELNAGKSIARAITPRGLADWALTNVGIVTENTNGIRGGTNAGDAITGGGSFDNVVLGGNALVNLTTVVDCTIIGDEALTHPNAGTATGLTGVGSFAFGGHTTTGLNAPGEYSSAFGFQAAKSAQGKWNTAIGAFSMQGSNTQVDMSENVAVGYKSLDSVTGAGVHRNIMIGVETCNTTSGGTGDVADNVVIGHTAMVGNNAEGNVVIGADAGATLFAGSDKNVIIGYNAGPATANPVNGLYIHNFQTDTPVIQGVMGATPGASSITINGDLVVTGGFTSGATTLDSNANLYGGSGAFITAASAANNVVFGTNAMNSVTDGVGVIDNVVLGSDAATDAGTVWDMVVIGHNAALTPDAFLSTSVVIGNNALKYVQTGQNVQNVIAIGDGALEGTTGARHNAHAGVFIGNSAGFFCTDSTRAVVIGNLAGFADGGAEADFTDCVAVGDQSMRYGKVIIGSTAVGSGALAGNSSVDMDGDYNTAVGFEALKVVRTGASNTAIGRGAGIQIGTGSTNICIGNQAGPTSGNSALSSKLYIHTSESDTPLIGGDFADQEVEFNAGAVSVVSKADTAVKQVSYVVMNSTTTATVTELYIDGATASERMVLADDTTWRFEADIVARRTDANDESSAYKITGCIDRNTGVATTAIVGTISTSVDAEDTAAWDVNATADTTNGSLKITVTGEASKTIKWIAFVNTTQVTG